MAAQKKHNGQSKGTILAEVGLVTLAAAAAGAWFLYGTEAGKKRRSQIKGWSLRMKADVIDKMEKMKEWNEEAYHGLIDSVATRYKNIKDINPEEVTALVRDLKTHWKNIKRQVEGGVKSPKAKKRPTAKKAPKADTASN
jgi:hypothetical protein